MKLPTISATVFALIALSTSAAANRCDRQDNALYTYIVEAEDAEDAGGICNGLWDNLKSAACVTSDEKCSEGDGSIKWSFDVGRGCGGGSVEGAWSKATDNKYGSIDCP